MVHLLIHHLEEHNSPSSLMDHLHIHHLQEYNSQTTNLVGYNKESKMVMVSEHVTVSSQTAVDVNILTK